MKAAIAEISVRHFTDEKWNQKSRFMMMSFKLDLSYFSINLAAADAGLVVLN